MKKGRGGGDEEGEGEGGVRAEGRGGGRGSTIIRTCTYV